MAYEVKLKVYEGPFDLLLDLISKQKVDIYDVPMAEITKQYLAYLDQMRELDLEITSEFLLTAATLLSIKAAGLLADEEEEEWEEELSPIEARQILITKLLEYKQFKNVACSLATKLEAEKKFFARDVELEERLIKLPPDFLKDTEPQELARLFCRLLAEQNFSLIDSEHVLSIPVSLDEKIDYILSRLRVSGRLSFTSLASDFNSRPETIVIFLALLELYKREQILLNQAETFGEIEVRLNETNRN